MTGVKISALPAANVANDTDQLEVNQSGTSRRVTAAQLVAVAGTGGLSITSFGGVSGQNCMAAFQAALAYGKARGALDLYFPPGFIAITTGTITVDFDNFRLFGNGGEVQHDNNHEPCFMLGTLATKISNIRFDSLTITQISVPIDLYGYGTSPYSGKTWQHVYAGIFAYHADDVEISWCKVKDFFVLISIDGKRDNTGLHVYLYRYWIHHCHQISATALCAANVVDGFDFHDNIMTGFQRLNTDNGVFIKEPHLIYCTDRSTPAKKNIHVHNNWVTYNPEGSCFVFRGCENVMIHDNYSVSNQHTMCDYVFGLDCHDNYHFGQNQPFQDQFAASFDFRGCKDAKISNLYSDTRGSYTCGYRFTSVDTAGGAFTEDQGRLDNTTVKNITCVQDDQAPVGAPFVGSAMMEVRGVIHDLDIDGINWTYDGVSPLALCRMGREGAGDDWSGVTDNVSFRNITILRTGTTTGSAAYLVEINDDVTYGLGGKNVRLYLDAERVTGYTVSALALKLENTAADAANNNRLYINGAQEGSFTPTVAFATNGTFVPAYNSGATLGIWRKSGQWVELWGKVTFNSNAYTGATGALNIGGLPFVADAGITSWPGEIGQAAGAIFASTVNHLSFFVPTGASAGQVLVTEGAGADTVMNIGNVPPSTTGFVFLFTIKYRTTA
jgi:hypothetical protein